MSAMARTGRYARLPPPFVFLASFLAGYGLERAVPLGRLLARGEPWTGAAGVALLGAGLLLVGACASTLAAARTTILPHGRPARLVTIGPYRLSRNPMYAGLVLSYVGTAGLMQLLWPLLLLPAPLLFLQVVVIPFEEARLEAAFGDAYADYRRRIRRWL